MKRYIYFIEFIPCWGDELIALVDDVETNNDVILMANVDDDEEFNDIISKKYKIIINHIIEYFFDYFQMWQFVAYIEGNEFWKEFLDFSKNQSDPHGWGAVVKCPDFINKVKSKLELYDNKSILLGIVFNGDECESFKYKIRKLDLWNMILIESTVDPMKKSDILNLDKLETIFKTII